MIKQGHAIETCDTVMFNFYQGLPAPISFTMRMWPSPICKMYTWYQTQKYIMSAFWFLFVARSSAEWKVISPVFEAQFFCIRKLLHQMIDCIMQHFTYECLVTDREDCSSQTSRTIVCLMSIAKGLSYKFFIDISDMASRHAHQVLITRLGTWF